MFWILATLFVLVDVYSLAYGSSMAMIQVQTVIVCLSGFITLVSSSPRIKSGFTVIVVSVLMFAITDWFKTSNSQVTQWIEIFICTSLLMWAAFRPYEFVSDDLSTDTVCLVFYKSNGGTALMCLFSLFGLPVSSMSIIAGNKWLKLVRKNSGLEIHGTSNVDINKYVIIDTNIPVCNGIEYAISKLKGAPAARISSLGLRLRCIASIRPLLSLLGEDWEPNSIFQQIPSIYFYKAVRTRNKIRGKK